MHVIASEAAANQIAKDGGSLYLWLKRSRCCGGGVTMLESATHAPLDKEFHRLEADAPFEVYGSMKRLPDELHVELKRKQLRAYWNGCVWVL